MLNCLGLSSSVLMHYILSHNLLSYNNGGIGVNMFAKGSCTYYLFKGVVKFNTFTFNTLFKSQHMKVFGLLKSMGEFCDISSPFSLLGSFFF